MLSLTQKELKLHEHATQYFVCRNKFAQKLPEDKNN